MDVGIMIAATAESGDIAEIAREVENLGYESFFIPEHPVIPIGFKTPLPGGGGTLPEHYGRWMDPFVALSVAAAVTRRVKLGTGICLLPEREPIVTAKTIALSTSFRADASSWESAADGFEKRRKRWGRVLEPAGSGCAKPSKRFECYGLSRNPAIRVSW